MLSRPQVEAAIREVMEFHGYWQRVPGTQEMMFNSFVGAVMAAQEAASKAAAQHDFKMMESPGAKPQREAGW